MILDERQGEGLRTREFLPRGGSVHPTDPIRYSRASLLSDQQQEVASRPTVCQTLSSLSPNFLYQFRQPSMASLRRRLAHSLLVGGATREEPLMTLDVSNPFFGSGHVISCQDDHSRITDIPTPSHLLLMADYRATYLAMLIDYGSDDDDDIAITAPNTLRSTNSPSSTSTSISPSISSLSPSLPSLGLSASPSPPSSQSTPSLSTGEASGLDSSSSGEDFVVEGSSRQSDDPTVESDTVTCANSHPNRSKRKRGGNEECDGGEEETDAAQSEEQVEQTGVEGVRVPATSTSSSTSLTVPVTTSSATPCSSQTATQGSTPGISAGVPRKRPHRRAHRSRQGVGYAIPPQSFHPVSALSGTSSNPSALIASSPAPILQPPPPPSLAYASPPPATISTPPTNAPNPSTTASVDDARRAVKADRVHQQRERAIAEALADFRPFELGGWVSESTRYARFWADVILGLVDRQRLASPTFDDQALLAMAVDLWHKSYMSGHCAKRSSLYLAMEHVAALEGHSEQAAARTFLQGWDSELAYMQHNLQSFH